MTALRFALLAGLALVVGQVCLADNFRVAAPQLKVMASAAGYYGTAPALQASVVSDSYRSTAPPLRTTTKTQDYRAQTPALRAATRADGFHARTPALQAITRPDGYLAAAPTLRTATRPDGYRATAPVLQAATRPDGYRASAPSLRAITKATGFQAAAPILSAVTKPEGFRASAPTLRAVTKTDRFAATTPALSAHALFEQDRSGPTTRDGSYSLLCEDLLQCFAEGDIRRVEDDMTALGYTPESYKSFCVDVAQSLGDCRSVATTSAEETPVNLADNVMALGGNPETFHLFRCIPLENYAIDLQRRSDSGEDTDAEELRLQTLISDASPHIISGRADLWCNQITSKLSSLR